MSKDNQKPIDELIKEAELNRLKAKKEKIDSERKKIDLESLELEKESKVSFF